MDKYYVYRPLLELISRFEGTAAPKGRGYNETLDYGKYTGGPVELVKMTLAQIDALQTKMLQHPKNKWNSSAAGAYQIVRTTRRGIESKLKLDSSLLYDEDMQDRMACFLLGQRGIDKYLAGRLKEDTLLRGLSAEWASFPKPDGTGTYKGQGVGGKVSEVRAALAEVRRRHAEGQPKQTEVVEVPYVPEEAETEVKKEANRVGFWTTLVGGLGAVSAWVAERDLETVLAFGGVSLVGLVILAFLGPKLAKSLRAIREELS